ncbi:MAG: hypothetical protein DMG32_02505 [Acidobacteria bacterium]|nr:MAG: hypothetical protein DMG32_02505 [Acidobacteriota bacterium]
MVCLPSQDSVGKLHGRAGLEGFLINFKGNHRIVVSVSLLHRSVAFDGSCVTPIGAFGDRVLEPMAS